MLEKSKKVLIFTTAFRPLLGGSEIAIEEICKRLNDFSFEILTPRYKKSFPADEHRGNICIHRLGLGNKLDKFLFPLWGMLKGRAMLRRGEVKLLHAYQASYGGGAAVLLKIFNPRKKFILTLQEGKSLARQNKFIKFFRNFILKRADTITAISNHLKEYARDINREAELFLIPNGVDFKKFYAARSVDRQQLGLKESDEIIITVSRLVSKNGIADLIKAMVRAKAEIPELKLIIIGSGPLETELKNLTRELNVRNDVLFLGAKEYEEIPHYLKSADMFVRPSLSEGLGTAFIEALAAGLPIVGTPVGGVVDFLKNDETGLFCETGNPKDIAEKIISILSNRELRERLIKNGLELAQKYDWRYMAEKFRQIYLSPH